MNIAIFILLKFYILKIQCRGEMVFASALYYLLYMYIFFIFLLNIFYVPLFFAINYLSLTTGELQYGQRADADV